MLGEQRPVLQGKMFATFYIAQLCNTLLYRSAVQAQEISPHQPIQKASDLACHD
jgi:hypothetical protein